MQRYLELFILLYPISEPNFIDKHYHETENPFFYFFSGEFPIIFLVACARDSECRNEYVSCQRYHCKTTGGIKKPRKNGWKRFLELRKTKTRGRKIHRFLFPRFRHYGCYCRYGTPNAVLLRVTERFTAAVRLRESNHTGNLPNARNIAPFPDALWK